MGESASEARKDSRDAARLALLIAWCARVRPYDAGEARPTYIMVGQRGSSELLDEASATELLLAAPKPVYITASSPWDARHGTVLVSLFEELPPPPEDPAEHLDWQGAEVRAAHLASWPPQPMRGADASVLVVGGPGRIRCRPSAFAVLGREYRLLFPYSLVGGPPDDPWTAGLPLAAAERVGVEYVGLVGSGSSRWIALSAEARAERRGRES